VCNFTSNLQAFGNKTAKTAVGYFYSHLNANIYNDDGAKVFN